MGLQLSLDRFQLVQNRTHSVTLVILLNLNLPPSERVHSSNIGHSCPLLSLVQKSQRTATVICCHSSKRCDIWIRERRTRPTARRVECSSYTLGLPVLLETVLGQHRPWDSINREMQYPYVVHATYRANVPAMLNNLRKDEEGIEKENIKQSFSVEKVSAYLQRSGPSIFHAIFLSTLCTAFCVTPTLFQLWNGTKLRVDKDNAAAAVATQADKNYGVEASDYILPSSILHDIGEDLMRSRSTIPSALGQAPRRID